MSLCLHHIISFNPFLSSLHRVAFISIGKDKCEPQSYRNRVLVGLVKNLVNIRPWVLYFSHALSCSLMVHTCCVRTWYTRVVFEHESTDGLSDIFDNQAILSYLNLMYVRTVKGGSPLVTLVLVIASIRCRVVPPVSSSTWLIFPFPHRLYLNRAHHSNITPDIPLELRRTVAIPKPSTP